MEMLKYIYTPGITQGSAVATPVRSDVTPATSRAWLTLRGSSETLAHRERSQRARERVAGAVGAVVASWAHVVSGVNIR